MNFQIIYPGKDSNWEEIFHFFLSILWIAMMNWILNPNVSRKSIRKSNNCLVTKKDSFCSTSPERVCGLNGSCGMKIRFHISRLCQLKFARNEIPTSRTEVKLKNLASESTAMRHMERKSNGRDLWWPKKHVTALLEPNDKRGSQRPSTRGLHGTNNPTLKSVNITNIQPTGFGEKKYGRNPIRIRERIGNVVDRSRMLNILQRKRQTTLN